MKPAEIGVNRRVMLAATFSGLFLSAHPALAGGAALRFDLKNQIAQVPEDFSGLSVEKVQLTDPDYFSPANTSLVAYLKRLSPHGVLRIGGNSSEFCWWAPAGKAGIRMNPDGIGRADNWMPQTFFPIHPIAVNRLKDFLDATGWHCIWGFNLGTASVAHNAQEAAFVAGVLGDRVKYFQIGNEPDFYPESNNRLRPAAWGFDDYLKEWSQHARAILQVVPQARFGGPDVGASSDWVIRFAKAAKPLLGDKLIALSGHYYASGPPDAKWVTIANLLKSNHAAAKRMGEIRPIADALHLGYRMSEGNSCYRGGKAGMSDAFAAALWGADYMLAMAAHGCAGINFHCGTGAAITHSLGGKIPGAFTKADRARAKLGAFYTPIAGNPQRGFQAWPLFYGMMLAESFAGTDMLAGSGMLAGHNATAYGGVKAGMLRMAVINKDAARDLTLPVDIGRKLTGIARLRRLTAPSLSARENVTFAGSAVAGTAAAWTVRKQSYTTFRNGKGALFVPRASALLALLPV